MIVSSLNRYGLRTFSGCKLVVELNVIGRNFNLHGIVRWFTHFYWVHSRILLIFTFSTQIYIKWWQQLFTKISTNYHAWIFGLLLLPKVLRLSLSLFEVSFSLVRTLSWLFTVHYVCFYESILLWGARDSLHFCWWLLAKFWRTLVDWVWNSFCSLFKVVFYAFWQVCDCLDEISFRILSISNPLTLFVFS